MSVPRASTVLTLPPRGAAPAYRWLCSGLRSAILEGRLRPGTRLPATRDLAKACGVSRGTIVAAFEQMKAEGYVTGRLGSGTYVNTVLPDALLDIAAPTRGSRAALPSRPRRLSAAGRRVRPFPSSASASGPARAFRANQPALDLFPTTLWAQIASRCLRRASTNMLRGCEPLGYTPLRKAVADYLGASRGVRCVPEQVAIVSGLQEALDLVGRLLLDPGDRVCMENPGYIGAALVFEALGARVSGVPLDDQGMVLPGVRGRDARLVYVTPAHQFPVGVSMTLPRRLALLDWARTSGALIFEDDYDSEYRYAGLPVPALQGLDRHGSVIFAGSFSKVLFPSIRLGYLVIPPDLVDRVAAMKSAASRYEPLLDQAVLCEFMTEGHFGRHVRRMREVYGARLAVLLDHARQCLTGLLELSPVEAGLQATGWLCGKTDGKSAAAAAAERNVEAMPLSRYSRTPLAREGLLLGFAAVDAREIQRGVQELAVALERCRCPRPPAILPAPFE
jgi:GntR family transcriptional regulator / MocR family aminotransferase